MIQTNLSNTWIVGYCFTCKKTIYSNQEYAHIEGQGIYHKDCHESK